MGKKQKKQKELLEQKQIRFQIYESLTSIVLAIATMYSARAPRRVLFIKSDEFQAQKSDIFFWGGVERE